MTEQGPCIDNKETVTGRVKHMPTTKKQLTVKPEFNDFLQAVDEYTAQLPLVIRMSFRQALHSEYEGDYEKVEELCRGMLASHPENTEVLARSTKRQKRPCGRFWKKNRSAILSA